MPKRRCGRRRHRPPRGRTRRTRAPTAAASASDGYGHRVYRSALTPWIVLAIGISVSLGLYANSLRDARRRARRGGPAHRGATPRRRPAPSSPRRPCRPATPRQHRVRERVARRGRAAHASWTTAGSRSTRAGASGIAALVPDRRRQLPLRLHGVDRAQPERRRARARARRRPRDPRRARATRRACGLTNIFQGSGDATGGARPEILAALVGSVSSDRRVPGLDRARSMNPDVLASEVLTRVRTAARPEHLRARARRHAAW